jgi:hypothetical protein
VHFRGVASTKGGSSSGLGAFKAALHLRGIIDHPVTATPQSRSTATRSRAWKSTWTGPVC